jgi:ABC-type transport system involved in multi-copper enzyme maturation permease subunit
MANLVTVVVGPLAGPECRRALSRGWPILVRLLAALALMGATLITLWIWWMSVGSDPFYQPYGLFRNGLITLEGMMLTIALVLGPAVLAGSIAGEKERGVLALLLTTRMTAREIVTGRVAGKLSQVAMVLMVGVPALVMLAALAGMSPAVVAVLLLLPAAVALGGAGLAVLASTVSRRGRDALLTVYMIDILCLLSPLGNLVGWSSGNLRWVAALNPFTCLDELVWGESVTQALASMGFWLALGLVTTAAAAWRLRPACLRPLDGERVQRGGTRRGRVPPVDERRPMLWKELYIERAGALGGLGWWLGALLVLLLGGGSLVLTVLVGWGTSVGVDPLKAVDLMRAFDSAALLIAFLIQWAVGLRAAVTISSERERGTWDALLTSPLEGREIVRAKLWGSLFSLKWLFLSALMAWTLAAGCGAMEWGDYWAATVSAAAIAAFMAAVGVRTSLSAPTATRAMAITIGVWLVALVAIFVVGWLVTVAAFLSVYLTISLATLGMGAPPPRWLMLFFEYAWTVRDAIYLGITLLLVLDTRLRFDRIAGRMTGGRVATAVDTLIHGTPHDPWRAGGEPDGGVAEEEDRLTSTAQA